MGTLSPIYDFGARNDRHPPKGVILGLVWLVPRTQRAAGLVVIERAFSPRTQRRYAELQ
jgi:hypothetical protein